MMGTVKLRFTGAPETMSRNGGLQMASKEDAIREDINSTNSGSCDLLYRILL